MHVCVSIGVAVLIAVVVVVVVMVGIRRDAVDRVGSLDVPLKH